MIIIKIQHENNVHTLPVQALPSVEVLRDLVKAMYGFNGDFELKFMDADGELIVVDCYEALLKALTCAAVEGDVETVVIYAVEIEGSQVEEEIVFDAEVIAQNVEERVVLIKDLIESYLREKDVKAKFEKLYVDCEEVVDNFVNKHSFYVEEHLNRLRAEVAVLGKVLAENINKVPAITGRLAPMIVENTNKAMEIINEHTDKVSTVATEVTQSAIEKISAAAESAAESAQPYVDNTQVVVSDFVTVVRNSVEPTINRIYMAASNEIERLSQQEKEEAPEEEAKDESITDLLILEQMGFTNQQKNKELLAQCNDLGEVVTILLGDRDM